jgi:hypothetical protein
MTKQLHLHVLTPSRAVCAEGPRPCQWTECRHRLEPKRPAEWVIPEPSCSLDVADRVATGTDKQVKWRWFVATSAPGDRVRVTP